MGGWGHNCFIRVLKVLLKLEGLSFQKIRVWKIASSRKRKFKRFAHNGVFGGVGRKLLFLAMKDLGTWEPSDHERIGKEAAFDQMFCK
jgi:hypothetical protein